MNTKNILILMFLIFFAAGASAQVYHYSGGNITDSANIITFKKPVRMMNINQDFGYGSTLWNFRLENDEGTIVWRANNDRDLMTYDDDGHIWNLTGTLQVNGVPISAGGGDAYLTNRQTFTKRNIFSDTLKADALSLMEQVRIADWFQVNGDVISDFMFLKGSRTFTGTTDNYGFVIKTADTNRIEIDSLGYVTINKRLSVGEYIIATDSITSAGFTAANMYFTDLGSSVYWRGYRSYIAEGTDELNYSSRLHNFLTKDGQNIMLELDSAAGMNLLYGSYTGSGSGLTNVDAITLKGQDTTHFARTDTLTTENIRGKWNFWDVVSFLTIPTIPSFFQNASRTIQYYLPQSASDTLATISQTQTITNKTISGSSNTITNLTRGSITFWNAILAAPADAGTYYCGGMSGEAPSATEANYRIYFPMNCTIKAISVWVWKGSGGGSELVTIKLKKNATTTDSVGTMAWATVAGYDALTANLGTPISITAGDFITGVIQTPTWASNPLNCRINWTIYYE